MGLVFYYLFHYHFFPLLLLLLGLKVNINQPQHLGRVLLFILQSYAAVLSEEPHVQYSADTCGLFAVVLLVFCLSHASYTL